MIKDTKLKKRGYMVIRIPLKELEQRDDYIEHCCFGCVFANISDVDNNDCKIITFASCSCASSEKYNEVYKSSLKSILKKL